MTPYIPQDDQPEPPECPTRGCSGRMLDVQPLERVRSDQFVLIKIQCPQCHAIAWRIVGDA